MKKSRQTLLVLLFCPIAALQAQPSAEVNERVLAEIEETHRQEQKAFYEGECEKLGSFFSDEASVYQGGRRPDSLERLEFCKSLPRPFGQRGGRPEITDAFHVLSEHSAYLVRTIDFAPEDEEASSFKREVVTKVFVRTDDGWKIVHFHSSVHEMPLAPEEVGEVGRQGRLNVGAQKISVSFSATPVD